MRPHMSSRPAGTALSPAQHAMQLRNGGTAAARRRTTDASREGGSITTTTTVVTPRTANDAATTPLSSSRRRPAKLDLSVCTLENMAASFRTEASHPGTATASPRSLSASLSCFSPLSASCASLVLPPLSVVEFDDSNSSFPPALRAGSPPPRRSGSCINSGGSPSCSPPRGLYRPHQQLQLQHQQQQYAYRHHHNHYTQRAPASPVFSAVTTAARGYFTTTHTNFLESGSSGACVGGGGIGTDQQQQHTATAEEEDEELLTPSCPDILAALATLHLVTVPENPRAAGYRVQFTIDGILEKQNIKIFYYEFAKRFHPDAAANNDTTTTAAAAAATDASAAGTAASTDLDNSTTTATPTRAAAAGTTTPPPPLAEESSASLEAMEEINSAYALLRKLNARQKANFMAWLTEEECGGYRLYAQLVEGSTSFFDTTPTAADVTNSGSSNDDGGGGGGGTREGNTSTNAASSSSSSAGPSSSSCPSMEEPGRNSNGNSKKRNIKTRNQQEEQRAHRAQARQHNADTSSGSSNGAAASSSATATVVITQDAVQLMGAGFYVTLFWGAVGAWYFIYRGTAAKKEQQHQSAKGAAGSVSDGKQGSRWNPFSLRQGSNSSSSNITATSSSSAGAVVVVNANKKKDSSSSSSAAAAARAEAVMDLSTPASFYSFVSYIVARYTAIVVAAVANAVAVRRLLLKLITGGIA